MSRAVDVAARAEPSEVQQGGIGAPQAHWLSLIDRGVVVSSAPQYGGPGEPRVVLRVVTHGVLTREKASELVCSLLSAIEWTGPT